MTLAPLTVACPECGSRDVFYSCKPECCFNHVCNQCYTTFELETERVGELQEDITAPPDPDPSAPTAPCARCGEYKIFAMDGMLPRSAQYLCVSCKALLALSITNVAKGSLPREGQ
ncbi:MAG: hypothetical protein LAO07_04620 [Acidobacteriia bacterium]|nr:hypothetical protein [Terriglobia bacterium]